MDELSGKAIGGIVTVVVIFIGLLVFGGMWGCPKYDVYKKTLEGEALLKRAEQERQIIVLDGEMALKKAEHSKKIMIETAKAELEAAQHRAEAIKVLGQMAKDFPEYREQQFILSFGEALEEGRINQIIYVPTEANIPILEATRNITK